MADLKTYRHLGQRFVKGWLEAPVLDVLEILIAGQWQDAAVSVAEIGVHHGKLFIGLQLLPPHVDRAVAIDLFADQHLNVDGSGEGDSARLRSNVSRWGDPQSLRVERADSTQLTDADLHRLLPEGAALFSVDGGHTREITCSDLRLAEKVCLPDGIVILDDVFNPGWPGVVEGLLGYLDDQPALQPFAIGFNKVFLAHSDTAKGLQEKLRSAAAPPSRWVLRETTFHGSEALVVTTRNNDLRGLAGRNRWAHRAYHSIKD